MALVSGDSAIFSGLDIDLEADAVRNAFFQRYLADRQNGVARGPTGYQALFPGWESLVAAEHRALEPSAQTIAEAHRTPKGGVPSDRADAAIPDRVGRYEVRGILGRGGMGIVYLAIDPTLSRTVVLKTLPSGSRGAARVEALARLIREARIAGRLDVEGICPVLDVVEGDRLFYVLMPFIPGKTLAQILDGSHDPSGDWCITAGEHDQRPEDAVCGELRVDAPGAGARRRRDFRWMLLLIQRIAQVLHQAHEAGVVHRDLKPGNIMVRPDGTPVILDFGLAVEGSDEGPLQLIAEGDVFGTPRYMAPEQIEGRIADIDRRTDVHALGVMLYEMIALRRPFEGPSTEAVHRLILEGKPRSLRAVVPGVSKDLDAVCAKAMAADRERRYATAADFAADVAAVLDHGPTIARPPSWPGRIAYAVRGHPVAAALALALVLATIALLVWAKRERAGGTIDYLHAYDRYRDAYDHYQHAGFDETLLSSADLDLLLGPFRDTGACGSLVRDPFSTETYTQIKKYAQGLPRGSSGQTGLEFRLRGPRGVVSTARPTFRFSRTPASGEEPSFLLRLEGEKAPAQAIGLSATTSAATGPASFALPEGVSLIPGHKYVWSLVSVGEATDSAPSTERRVSGRFDLVAVSPAEREALLRECPRTGRESLDALIRAGVLIAHDYLDDGLSELDRLPQDASPSDRAAALMLRAEAAYHMDDEEAFYKFRDEALALRSVEQR